MCWVKLLAFTNFISAIVAISFQIAALVHYTSGWQNYELFKVGIGIWGGLIIGISGYTNWVADDKEKKDRTFNRASMIFALLATICSIIMIGIFAGLMKDLDHDNVICSIHMDSNCLYAINGLYFAIGEAPRSLAAVLLFVGVFTFFVNCTLSFITCCRV